MKTRETAIYPGTFDPLTNGHLDVIERARRCFPTVVLAVSQHPGKDPLFPLEERVGLAKEVVSGIDGVEVDTFEGLLVDYVRRRGDAVVIKGLRTGDDFEYERQMAQMNAAMADVETVFLMTSPAVAFVSSTLVREIARFDGDVSAFVPAEVARRMKEKLRGEA